MTCGTNKVYGILLSTILTALSSIVCFVTFVMTPMACLLASAFTALTILADVRANTEMVSHLGWALCACVGIVVALLV